MYSPVLMKRMLEQENLSSDILTLNELNDYLYSNIWSEVRTKSEISKARRGLQKLHLGYLIDMLVNPQFGAPEDARSVSFKILSQLKKDLGNYRGGNDFDSFHLKECESRIDKALNYIIVNQHQ